MKKLREKKEFEEMKNRDEEDEVYGLCLLDGSDTWVMLCHLLMEMLIWHRMWRKLTGFHQKSNDFNGRVSFYMFSNLTAGF